MTVQLAKNLTLAFGAIGVLFAYTAVVGAFHVIGGAVGNDDREFVATQPAGGNRGIGGSNPVGDRADQPIAIDVTDRVVDELQMIDIGQNQSERTPIGDVAFEQLIEMAAIG